MNSAKGRLRTLLFRDSHLQRSLQRLFFLDSPEVQIKFCSYYNLLFSRLEAYPLDNTRLSIRGVLEEIEDIDWSGQDWDPINPNFIVDQTVGLVKGIYHGLCLDCMDKHKKSTAERHSDYWLHARTRNWDKNCRIKHGQMTWFFSFMGQ